MEQEDSRLGSLKFFWGLKGSQAKSFMSLVFFLTRQQTLEVRKPWVFFHFMCCSKPRHLAFGFLHDGGKTTFSREGFSYL
jgi:hypothetical protein